MISSVQANRAYDRTKMSAGGGMGIEIALDLGRGRGGGGECAHFERKPSMEGFGLSPTSLSLSILKAICFQIQRLILQQTHLDQ